MATTADLAPRKTVGGIFLSRHWSVGALCSFMGLAGILGAIIIKILKYHLAAVARRTEIVEAIAASAS